MNMDGKNVGYVVIQKGLIAVYVSPIDGSHGHVFTPFGIDPIIDFHWSPDNSRFGMIRMHSDNDVVILKQTNAK